MLQQNDKEIFDIIEKEKKRQLNNIELIASENYVSSEVLEAVGSILTNKYAEGYPGKRYYGGCENVDEIENIAIERCKKLFSVKYANVQPHSGSQANMAAYRALLQDKDVILGMSLDAGGHLTHGYKLSFSGQTYTCYSYGVNPETGYIDYDEVERIALEVKPKLIVAGASAYPRIISFEKFRKIADKVGAYLMVDMAHIAGLVATGCHPNPCEYADIVTSTTHKTLRGTRGGIILTNDEEIAKKVNKNVFPGIQGGPLCHVIAGKAVAFGEDLKDDFKEYCKQVVKNAKQMADAFIKKGYKLITGGTDNHLILIDVFSSKGVTGKEAETILDKVSITVNKNSIPNDSQKPMVTSGIRVGTPAVTTRGFKEAEMLLIVDYIDEALTYKDDEEKLQEIRNKVIALTSKFPLDSLK